MLESFGRFPIIFQTICLLGRISVAIASADNPYRRSVESVDKAKSANGHLRPIHRRKKNKKMKAEKEKEMKKKNSRNRKQTPFIRRV